MKKQHRFILFLSLLLFVTTIIVGEYIESQDCMNKVNITFKSGDTQETLNLFYSNDIYYAFLPSNANIKNIQLHTPSGYAAKIDDTLVTSKLDNFVFQTDTEYNLQIINRLGIKVASETFIILQSKNIPSVSITLLDGTIKEINSDKNISKTGVIQTTLSDNTTDFRGGFDGFHGRGNSSWGQEKKSYTIEFEKDVSLLGMESGTKWLLISNSFDESSLRNKLVYDTAKEFGVKFAIDSAYVDLYVNKQYMGLYLLCEKIEVSQNSVNITDLQEKTQQVNLTKLSSFTQFQESINGIVCKGFSIPNNPTDITGGYLLQIDSHNGTIEQEISFIKTTNTPAIVSSPKNATKEQIIYISKHIDGIEKSISLGDLSEIDIDSFATQIILSEYFANTDDCSIYLFKDSDECNNKLFCGPLWDYDLSMGNRWNNANADPYVLYAKNIALFKLLYNNENFYDSLKEIYREKFQNQLKYYVTEKLSVYKQLIEPSFIMDKTRWKHIEKIDDEINNSQTRFDTLEEHIYKIDTFLTQRHNFLNDVWLNNIEYCSVTFSDNNEFKKTYHIKKGDMFNEFSPSYSPTNEATTFVGWFDNNNNEYELGERITENKTYIAKFSTNNPTTSEQTNTPESKNNTLFLIKTIFYKLTKIEFELWCFGAIFSIVAITIIKDLFFTKHIRRGKNGKRT